MGKAVAEVIHTFLHISILPVSSTLIGAGPVLVESMIKLVGLPGWTLADLSTPGPDTFTLLASPAPEPFPPVLQEIFSKIHKLYYNL